jgi:hypothetical protein
MDAIKNITTDDAIREPRGELPEENDDRSGIGPIPIQTDPDMDAIIEHLMTGKPLDPEVARRVREQSDRVRQEILEKHGVPDIGTQIIRELRGPLDEDQERELTLAQRDFLRDSDGPPRLLNPDTGETYVLLNEREYERLRRGDR